MRMVQGLAAVASILKSVGAVVREVAEAAHYQGMFRQGTDLNFEDKQERCAILGEQLSHLWPRLEELAGGKGRSAQLAGRACKSLARVLGENQGDP
jgi:hypothetical protein